VLAPPRLAQSSRLPRLTVSWPILELAMLNLEGRIFTIKHGKDISWAEACLYSPDSCEQFRCPESLRIYHCRTFKVEHVKHQPWAEACWYFPDSREQFRLGGDLVVIGPDHPDAHLREASSLLLLSRLVPVICLACMDEIAANIQVNHRLAKPGMQCCLCTHSQRILLV